MKFTDFSKQYVASASEFLKSKGFVPSGESEWSGNLTVHDKSIPITILLKDFPGDLPEIYLKEPLEKYCMNISDRKICIGTPNVFMDIRNIEGIIRDSLQRAEVILDAALNFKQNPEDFEDELLYYWPNALSVASLLDPESPTSRFPAFTNKELLDKQIVEITGTKSELDRWVTVQYGISTIGMKYYDSLMLHLQKGISPGEFQLKGLETVEVIRFLREKVDPSDMKELKAFLDRKGRKGPAVLILSLPAKAGRILVALVGIPGTDGVDRYSSADVKRQDKNYLLRRGGASTDFMEKSVAIVGCGSVGSRIAEYLAGVGIGEIRLIDPDLYEVYNIHRHLLPVSSAGKNKCCELRTVLSRRYPDLNFPHEHKSIQQILNEKPDFVLNADLIVTATGNHSLELQLNEFFFMHQKRAVYAWVEPLGLGGHVLVSGLKAADACFECIFETYQKEGIVNRSAFAAPAQEFSKTEAGCGGAFIPFSIMQSARIALEATQLCVQTLMDPEKEAILLNWFGNDTEFKRAGFRLSKRAERFSAGEIEKIENFKNRQCRVCSTPARG